MAGWEYNYRVGLDPQPAGPTQEGGTLVEKALAQSWDLSVDGGTVRLTFQKRLRIETAPQALREWAGGTDSGDEGYERARRDVLAMLD